MGTFINAAANTTVVVEFPGETARQLTTVTWSVQANGRVFKGSFGYQRCQLSAKACIGSTLKLRGYTRHFGPPNNGLGLAT